MNVMQLYVHGLASDVCAGAAGRSDAAAAGGSAHDRGARRFRRRRGWFHPGASGLVERNASCHMGWPVFYRNICDRRRTHQLRNRLSSLHYKQRVHGENTIMISVPDWGGVYRSKRDSKENCHFLVFGQNFPVLACRFLCYPWQGV